MQAIYSINARLGSPGIGRIAWQAIQGLYSANLLQKLFVSSVAQPIPEIAAVHQWHRIGRGLKYLGAKDPTGLIYHLEGLIFDRWVATHMKPSGIFHGWSGATLQSQRRAHQLGLRTVVERASTHPRSQQSLLFAEHASQGVTVHWPGWNLTRLETELAEADFITVPSPFARESLVSNGISADRLIEIPFGVDTAHFIPAPFRGNPHPFRLIFVGQLTIRKGILRLLEVWQRLNWKDAELWLVGAVAPDFQPLQKRYLHLAGVRWIPYTTNLVLLFHQADVFIFLSVEEGSALVTYEALACGLPLVTTPNAGAVARDGVEGFLIQPYDIGYACERLEQLRASSELRRTMAQAARARAEAFTWDLYRDRLVMAYRGILEAHRE